MPPPNSPSCARTSAARVPAVTYGAFAIRTDSVLPDVWLAPAPGRPQVNGGDGERARRVQSAAMCCATRAATSWPTMGGTPDRSNTILATSRLLRRFATRRSRRIGSRISGEIEKNAPADANGLPFAGNGKGPPGGPQNKDSPTARRQAEDAVSCHQQSWRGLCSNPGRLI